MKNITSKSSNRYIEGNKCKEISLSPYEEEKSFRMNFVARCCIFSSNVVQCTYTIQTLNTNIFTATHLKEKVKSILLKRFKTLTYYTSMGISFLKEKTLESGMAKKT